METATEADAAFHENLPKGCSEEKEASPRNGNQWLRLLDQGAPCWIPQVFGVDHHDVTVEPSGKDRRDGKRFGWGPRAGYRNCHLNTNSLMWWEYFSKNGIFLA